MADEKIEFKYRAEYAKSSRSSCKACKTGIQKEVLRLAVLAQSPKFDGKIPYWYHHMCFFGKQKPTTVADIEGFESLKWDDQEKIRKKIEERMGGVGNGTATSAKSDKKPSKRALSKASAGLAKDFTVEYAKSSRAMCRGCEVKIAKAEVRISKKDFESEDALRYGGKDLWHHVQCFAKLRSELEYFESGDVLPGFVTLAKEDQETVKKALPKIEKAKVKTEEGVKDEEEPASKKVKKENKEEEKIMKKQNEKLHSFREKIKDLRRPEFHQLFEYNGQDSEAIAKVKVDHLADCITFGAIQPCDVCKGGQYQFKSGIGYQCKGNLNEWTKCLKIVKAPKRKPFKFPADFLEEHPEFESYKCRVEERKIVFNDIPTTSVKKETESTDDVDSGPKVQRFAPLRNLHFFIIGKMKQDKENLKKTVVQLGGTVSSKFDRDLLTAVISTEAEVEKCHGKMEDAKDAGIHVVPESFVEEVKKGGDVPELIAKLSISPWGTNLQGRISAANLKSAALKSDKSKSVYTKSVPAKQTLKIKDGLAVDPDSGLEDVASIYIDKPLGPFNVVLSKTDIQSGHNSYYKLQLLKSDHSSKKFFVFRSWGRIGTTIGGTKTENFSSLDSAKKEFYFHYRDKTGNSFEDKDDFVKKPGLYYPVDVAYGDETDSMTMASNSGIPSKLHASVQQLVSMLFDVEMMKKVMLEFELDLEKMPLGKLSRKQIQKAFSVLSELQQKDGDIKPAVVIDATNRFYTLIPHSFGMGNPPPLDNEDIIKSKIEMLESLLEMETAYNILKESKGDTEEGVHPLDKHYEKLNTHIEVIEKGSEEYTLIDTYVKNTHGETHTMYELEIVEVFKVKRQGEEKRFKPFKKLHNRKLLWHGSRLTNFAGILSQGLRIAPPEAPVSGYMFGKGIYFADMVTKSANYCMASRQNSTGLLLLCEVALGEMYERTHAEYVEKLPPGKHSTKGIGVTSPDPELAVKLDDGVEVPVGKGVKTVTMSTTSLLYNEYIVYDPAQVKTRYLLKTKFNYKY